MIRILILLVAAALNAAAASWYVDSAATGSANGTSWANAWTTPASIAWSSIASGDTIWFDGGASSKSYPGFNIGKSGSGSGRITIRCSQDSGRNGMVKFTYGISTQGNTNITINGAKDDAFNVPSSVTDLWSITNNLGIMWDDPSTEAITANNAQNCTFQWLWIKKPGDFSTGNDGVNGITGPNSGGGSPRYSNLEIAYCYIHDGSQDGVNFQYSLSNTFDQARVHHCLLIDNVDDGVQFGGDGLTVDHCIIGGRNATWQNGHPDCVQVSGSSRLRIYNNILYNAYNSFIYNEIGTTEGAVKGDLYIYGNLCYNQREWDSTQEANYSLYLQHWTDQNGGINPNGPYDQTILTNVYIVHNTLYHTAQNSIQLTQTRQAPTFTRTMASFVMPAEGANVTVTVGNTNWVDLNELVYVNNAGVFKLISLPSATQMELQNLENTGSGIYPGNVAPGTTVTTNARSLYFFRGIHNVIATNAVIANNLIFDGAYKGGNAIALRGREFLDNFNADPLVKEGFLYTTNEAWMDRNVTAGVNKSVSYHGTNYANAAAFNDVYGFTHWDDTPAFTSTNTYDFTLTAEDNAARDHGLDLTSLTNKLTGLETDLWGTRRGTDGLWDIGANEFTSPGLVLLLNFQDAFTGGTITDVSGNGNSGLRRGRCGETTNWPVAVTVTNGYTASTGGRFSYYWDNYGTYLRSGDYVAVTNLNAGTALEKFTVMVWARYDQAHNNVGELDSWTTDHNATLIDNGQYLTAGSWRLGRENFWDGPEYPNRTKWTVFSGSDATTRLQLTFDDYADAYGGTDAMRHYCVTFDRGTNRLYLNGVEVTNKVHAQTTLKLNTTTHWMGIGGWPHHGSTDRDPWLTSGTCPSYDEYPNTFWFKGWMDNVRLYTNTLTAAQVLAIYEAEAGTEPPVLGRHMMSNNLHAGLVAHPGFTPAIEPLYREGFEGTGYENGGVWTEGGTGTVNEDSTANATDGSQSLLETATSNAAYSYLTLPTALSEVWVFANVRLSSVASARVMVAVQDASGTTLGYTQLSSSNLRIGIPGDVNEVNYAGEANTWYYVWLHYKAGPAGSCDVAISKTGQKSGATSATSDAISASTQAKRILLGSTSETGVSREFDHVIIDSAVIGSYP